MSFLDVRFPPAISFGAVGGPAFSTTVAVRSDGRESRNRNWAYELSSFDVSHAAREEALWRELLAFFRVTGGRFNTFRFKDWSDYVCASGEGSFITSTYGSPTGKQMVKAYTFGGQTVYRIITKPISGKITTDATGLDYATGIATAGTTWYGEFDLHARLDVDQMQLETLNKQRSGALLAGWGSIRVQEVRE